jgi:protein-S-isoprenylcysteine O-methyltransferase Ste14
MRITKSARIFGSGPFGLVASIVFLAGAVYVDRQFETPPLLDSHGLRSVILAVSVLVTVALVVWSVKSLPASDRGCRLCTDGAFKHVRHPLYAAFLSVFNFGLAIYLNSHVFVAWAVLLHPLWHHVVRYEEQLMIEIFGDEYVNYQKVTGRFVPRSRLWHRGSVSR